MKQLIELWNLMKGSKLKYLTALSAIALSALLSFLSPMIVRTTIDSVIGNQPLDLPHFGVKIVEFVGGTSTLKQNIWICSIILFLIAGSRGLFQFAKGKLSAEASESILKNLREMLFNHIQKLPFSYHSKIETGDLIQRCTSDLETIKNFLSMQLLEIGRILFMIALVLPFMLKLNWQMTLLSLIFIPFIFGFSVFFFYKVQDAFKTTDEAEASMSNILQENITGVRVVRAFAKQHDEIEKFEDKNRHFSDSNFRHIRLLALFWGLSDFMCFTQLTIVLSVGVYFAATGKMTLGTLTAFLSYSSMLIWPIRHLGTNLTDMGKTAVSVERIREILANETEEMGSESGNKIEGNISFKDVSFKYEDQPILEGISFDVKKGETIAILGKTGSGKSTLMQLLPRFYDYQSGSISVDGKELKDISKSWIRKNIAFILQEPFLFSKSIYDNIRVGAWNSSKDDVENAAKIASVHSVISDFEKGYETMVGERGVTLSGGQKQRVAIARSLILETPIIVFDDSLSAVDTETDTMIRNALVKRQNKATTFIIAHRITTLAEADKILVLDQGKIVQEGTHEKLVNEEGLYQRIWAIQNNLEEELENEMDYDDHSVDKSPFKTPKNGTRNSA